MPTVSLAQARSSLSAMSSGCSQDAYWPNFTFKEEDLEDDKIEDEAGSDPDSQDLDDKDNKKEEADGLEGGKTKKKCGKVIKRPSSTMLPVPSIAPKGRSAPKAKQRPVSSVAKDKSTGCSKCRYSKNGCGRCRRS